VRVAAADPGLQAGTARFAARVIAPPER
jgi:hypothetical protein